MIKIAICDDLGKDREALRAYAGAVWEKEAEITCFSTGSELLADMREKGNNAYHLIFLDIFLKGDEKEHFTGIDIGKRIKELDCSVEIVLVSISREFGPEAFEINAIYYLAKPLRIEMIRKVKERFEEKNGEEAVLVVKIHGREKEISFSLFSYIENMHNNLNLYLKNGNMIQIRESLNHFEQKLDDRFLKINRGIIVNMEAIESMDSEICEIAGTKIPMSRGKRKECRKIYNDYLFSLTTEKRR